MSSAAALTVVPVQPPRLLDQLQQSALARFGRPEPGQRFVEWVRRFILFTLFTSQESVGGQATIPPL
jgi:hypothetical protein